MLIHMLRKYFCLFLVSLKNCLCISINSPLSLKIIHLYYLIKLKKKQEFLQKKTKFLGVLGGESLKKFVIYLKYNGINRIKEK